MKLRLILSSIICLLLVSYTNAQSTTKTRSVSPVTKGYYSIGNNAEKLNNGPALQLVQTSTHYTAEKGYYTISEKRQKLPKSYKLSVPAYRSKTAVKKGYYSIGENAEKL